VAVSYFEWYQNKHNEHWPTKDVLEKLELKLEKSFGQCWDLAKEKAIPLREACYLLAIERVVETV